jgi:hypothetical protein
MGKKEGGRGKEGRKGRRERRGGRKDGKKEGIYR